MAIDFFHFKIMYLYSTIRDNNGNGSKLQEDKIAREQNCTKPNLHEGTKMHEGTTLHEDDFAPRVNFARVTFFHESKK